MAWHIYINHRRKRKLLWGRICFVNQGIQIPSPRLKRVHSRYRLNKSVEVWNLPLHWICHWLSSLRWCTWHTATQARTCLLKQNLLTSPNKGVSKKKTGLLRFLCLRRAKQGLASPFEFYLRLFFFARIEVHQHVRIKTAMKHAKLIAAQTE